MIRKAILRRKDDHAWFQPPYDPAYLLWCDIGGYNDERISRITRDPDAWTRALLIARKQVRHRRLGAHGPSPHH